MVAPLSPAAFLSYAHVDDRFGGITAFRERLAHELEMQTGDLFPIFQDRDLLWGEQWRERIQSALAGATFLIPFVSPSFFKSAACRSELLDFERRERELGRGDLILPIYYIQAAAMHDTHIQSTDPVAALLASRQYVDWRPLRLESPTDPQIWKAFARLAEQVRLALGRPMATSGFTTASTPPEIQNSAQLPRLTAGPEPVSEAPLRLVDAADPSAFRNVADALRVADAGDRIAVRPGIYRESLQITKAVQILGQGDRAHIVIEVSGRDAISITSDWARLSNLTIRQTGGPGTWYAIDIIGGRPEVDNCDITSASLACICVRSRARPHIHDNILHDGRDAGALYALDAGGVFESNEVRGNRRCGLDISEGADPIVRRNRIFEQGKGGVYVQQRGLGTIEDNEIFANGSAAVEVFAGSRAIVRRNRIHHSTGSILVDGATAAITENDIFAAVKYAGIEVVNSTAEVSVQRNRVASGAQGGIFVSASASALIEDNNIIENQLTGVEVGATASAVLHRNTIRDNVRSGVYIEGGIATLQENIIERNGGEGVYCLKGGSVVARSNTITGNARRGITVEGDSHSTLENNAVSENRLGDSLILSEAPSHPTDSSP